MIYLKTSTMTNMETKGSSRDIITTMVHIVIRRVIQIYMSVNIPPMNATRAIQLTVTVLHAMDLEQLRKARLLQIVVTWST